MPNLNKVMLMGNLTRDPEVSFLPNQTAICKIGLATNRRWTGQDGQQKEEVTFVDCTAFGKTGETIGKYLKKGRPIFIEGRLHYRQWDAQDGTKRSKLDVIVETFQFVDARTGGGGEGGEAGGSEGNYQPRQPYGNRPPMRPTGRPAAQGGPMQHPQSMDQPPPMDEEEAPPIQESDIPF